jgi:hypothetical protein
MVLDGGGNLHSGSIITWGYDTTYDTTYYNQFFINVNGDYYMGAQTYGFSTSLQSAAFTSTKYNVFVMKYQQTKPTSYNCIQEETMSVNEASSLISSYEQSAAYSFSSSGSLSSGTDVYIVYSSPYSGAFSLLDTMYIPRACAYISQNMTSANYYYGQWASEYDLKSSSGANMVAAQMGSNYEFIFQNGSSCDLLATYESDNATIWIQSDDENMVGTQRVMLRGCD